MKSIGEFDHYELLEIPRSATPSEIDRAYRTAQQIYADGSLALYSIFESEDAATIRASLDEAYRILADPETREAYDREFLFDDSASDPASATQESDSSSVSSAVEAKPMHSATPADLQPAQYRSDSIEEVVEEYDALEDDDVGEFDGPRLRRTRLFRGYEIDDIAGVTKVTGSHLRNIEAENFNLLPADVYVRGFVTAYAKTIGLDPDFVVPSYMARVQQSRGDAQRVGFLGRR